MSLPDTTVAVKDSVDAPISVENLTGLGIYSFEARIVYDSTVVRFSQLVTAGTLSANFTTSYKDTLDTLRVAAAGSTALSGSGVLIKLRFRAAPGATVGLVSPLNFVKGQFNEPGPNTPTATTLNGRISIGSAAPAAPMLTSPPDSATGVSTTVTLSWSVSTGATSYRLQLSTDSTFTATTFDSSIGTTSVIRSGLANNTKYFWRVSATNAGGTSAFSATFRFTTIIVPPAMPTLVSPSDNATGVSTTVTLSWSVSTGATSYRVQLSTDSTFATTVFDSSGIVTTSVSRSGLANNTKYFWRVNATGTGGTSAFSTAFRFTTIVAPPPAPTLVSPTDGAIGVSTSPTLIWGASTGAASYTVQVSLLANFSTIVVNQGGITTNSFSLSGLGNNTTYYWRVSATNAGGTSPFSAARSFTTIIAVPDVPTLVSPNDTATGVLITPTLVWNRSARASTYRLQVSKSSLFPTTVFDDSTLVDTTKQVGPLGNDTTYFWRVSAKNIGGASLFSAVRSFKTVVKAPPAPALLLPADLDSTVSITPTLVWNSAQGANTYRLQVAKDTSFVTTVFNDSTLVDTTKQVGPLGNDTTYFWRVNAKNAGGAGPYSQVRSFKTVPKIPLAPKLLLPADRDSVVADTAKFVWNSVAGAKKYRLQISKDTSFVLPVFNDSTLTDTTKQVGPLGRDSTYYWRVSAKNDGGVSPFSLVRSFRTVPKAPAAPRLLFPSDRDSLVALTPKFVWNLVTGAKTYRLQVSNDTSFARLVFSDSTLVDTTKQVGPLGNDSTYYWRVSAKNAGGVSPFSAVRSFRTIAKAPSAPTLISPADGDSAASVTPNLIWNVAKGASTYRLQVALDIAFVRLVFNDSTLVDTTKQIGPLGNDSTYYWRVSAKNAGGVSPFSAVRSFKTIVATPAAPALVSPADSATNVSTSPTLSWTASARATSYRVQVSTSSTFVPLVFDQSGIAGTSVTVPGLSNSTTYFWRVSAKNAGGTSAFSAVRSFATVIASPVAPTLLSPADGATGVSTSPTLSWTASSSATSYRLQISKTTSFIATVFDDSTLVDTTKQVGPLSNDSTYFWRVSAKNAGGFSPFSAVRSFKTIVATPAAPALLSPADSATNVSTSPTLSWTASARATSYRVQVSTSSTFVPLGFDQSGITGTSVTVTGLSKGTIYFWRVSATNAGGTSGFSAVRRFTTIVNRKPVFNFRTPASLDSVSVNVATTFRVSATDPDGDVLTYTWKVNGVQEKTGSDSSFVRTFPGPYKTQFTVVCVFSDPGGLRDSTTWSNFFVTKVEKDGEFIPTDFSLSQNYPNPFNPSTTIHFGLPHGAAVRLEIYNVLGVKVRTLIAEEKMNAGSYSVTWDGLDDTGGLIPSGVYIYRIQAGDFHVSKKMTLLK